MSAICSMSHGIRHTVHVVSEATQERASMARMVLAAGHHSEVYSDVAELINHRPLEGIVFAHEAENCGAALVCEALTQNGMWLPVVGFGLVVEARRIVKGMKAGAIDYIVGQTSPDILISQLNECAIEAKRLLAGRTRRANAKSSVAKLSQREREVLDLLVLGMSNKEMARELEISPRTVEIHRMKMMGKIGATSTGLAVSIRIDTLD